jgi:hypothetical protein
MNNAAYIGGLLLVAFLTVGAQPPSTAAAPSHIQPLITKLSSSSWQERQEAKDALSALGDKAVEPLRKLISATTDPEVRASAETILGNIAENDRNGPTRLTLHFDEEDSSKVLAAICKQAQCGIQIWPERALDQARQRITIHCDNSPFWDVMKEFCAKAGVAPRAMGMTTDLTLAADKNAGMMGVSYSSGPCLIIASGTTATQNVTYQTPEQFRNGMTVAMTLYVEPKIYVAGYSPQPTITEAIDDKGKSWRSPPPPEAIQMDRRGGMMGREHVVNFSVPLTRPADCGKKLVKLSGTIPLFLASTQRIEFENAMNVKNVEKKAGDQTVVLRDIVSQHGDGVEVILAFPGAHPALGFMHRESGLTVKLVDANGRSWFNAGGMGSPRPGRNEQMDYGFDFIRHRPGGNAGDPDRLIVELPGTPRQVKVPFEFKDLRLPKNPDEE